MAKFAGKPQFHYQSTSFGGSGIVYTAKHNETGIAKILYDLDWLKIQSDEDELFGIGYEGRPVEIVELNEGWYGEQ